MPSVSAAASAIPSITSASSSPASASICCAAAATIGRHFLIDKYGVVCTRLFLLTIAFRLLNEVWSNTKVMALYFGSEGSPAY